MRLGDRFLNIHPLTGTRSVASALALIVLWRSAVFVFWESSYFDSNQAVIGLMARHLSQLRAFPLFMYGQNYQLGVEAWLAAPLMAVTGPSVTALKLPLLAMNLVVAFLLLRGLVRQTQLPPVAAGFATLLFALPAPAATVKLLEASGGIFEPLLYVLLLWFTWHRPAWCGLVLGVGVLHREFTIYGFVALLLMDALRRSLFTREALTRLVTVLAVSAAVWLAVLLARPYSSAMGPGTTPADLPRSAQNLVEAADRICLDVSRVPRGLADIAAVHWPLLFGTKVQRLSTLYINTRLSQGMKGAGWVLGAAMLLAALRILVRVTREGWRREYEFCAYLVLVAAASVAGYVIGRCGLIQPSKMRYEMLSLLGAVGLSAWYLRVETKKWLKIVWITLILAYTSVNAVGHARLWSQYVTRTPLSGKRLTATELETRGIRYAISDYGISYPVAFLTDERVIVASTSRVRIASYQREFNRHRKEAVYIARRPCAGGTKIRQKLYFCPPEPAARRQRTRRPRSG